MTPCLIYSYRSMDNNSYFWLTLTMKLFNNEYFLIYMVIPLKCDV